MSALPPPPPCPNCKHPEPTRTFSLAVMHYYFCPECKHSWAVGDNEEEDHDPTA